MKKIKKNKNVIKVTLGLAAVALGTVGFSSWVISGVQNGTGTASNVTVSADKVLDKRITMAISAADTTENADTNWKLAFGPNATTGKRITADKTNEDLKLQFKITFSLTDKTQSELKVADILKEYDLKIKCEPATSAGADSAFNSACSSDKLIVPPVALTNTEVDLVTTGNAIKVTPGQEAGGELVYTVDLIFAWGAAFNNTNPIVYFNQDTKADVGVDPTNKDNAKTVLKKLAGINEAKINYTVSLKAKAK